MATHMDLDVDSVARIGLLFIDGDSLRDVLLDKIGHTDYDFDKFNTVKHALTRIERINPGLGVQCILWQRRVNNPHVAVPLVCGKSLPLEGWQRVRIGRELAHTYDTGAPSVRRNSGSCASHYYPVTDSENRIAGVLELLIGHGQILDL